MAKKPADAATVRLIRQVAATPEQVEVYRTAKYSLMGADLTKEDVCDAICDWIDAGEDVLETPIHTIPELIGETAYEMKPRLSGQINYVKVALEKRGEDWLLILSAHPDL